jgi:glucosamine-6-phosphate deaminase
VDAAAVAEQVAALLLAEARRSGHRPLGLATGRTMEPVYAALAHQLALLPPSEQAAVRRGWCSFNLDAYVGLDAADPRSFAAEMTRRLTTPLGLDPQRVHLPDGQAADPQAAAECYAAQQAAAGGIGSGCQLGLERAGLVTQQEHPAAGDGCDALGERVGRLGTPPAQVDDRYHGWLR